MKKKTRLFLKACKNNNLKMVQRTIKQGIGIHDLEYAMLVTTSYGYYKITKCLVDHGVDVNTRGGLPLYYATEIGCFDIVKLLIEHGALTPCRFNVLLVAVKNGHIDIVKYFVEECNVDIHTQNNAAMKSAIVHRHLDIAKYLMDKGINIPNAIPDYLIDIPVIFGHTDVVIYLIENGVNPNKISDYAITVAKDAGHFEVLNYLKTKGDLGYRINI